ncbi:hypothetical protein CFBP5877_18650 [Agrobacterium tumefaciens]|uniref:Uncharacterized protein n=1 Tax=Agrobacterium tumefaciens TaxID=358 RepID=A0AAE6BFR3_AGRTU|nr:hypothetical protein [Agrobacterium tumefaciens]QCL81163.1 hypothetical protein CFBP5877_18650 [Agrobacterium tumefaciens]
MANKGSEVSFTGLIGVVVVALFVGVIYFTGPVKPSVLDRVVEYLPKTFAGKSEPPIRRWLYDFQGLVGGLLALAAGAITIFQMRLTDRDAAARHDEAMALAREANRNAVERALNPTILNLSTVNRYLDRVEKDVRSKNTFEMQNEELRSQAWLLAYIHDGLVEALSREQFVVGSALFPGKLAYKITYLKKLAEENGHKIAAIDKNFGHGAHRPATAKTEKLLREYYSPFFEMCAFLPELIGMLRSTAEKHQIEID